MGVNERGVVSGFESGWEQSRALGKVNFREPAEHIPRALPRVGPWI